MKGKKEIYNVLLVGKDPIQLLWFLPIDDKNEFELRTPQKVYENYNGFKLRGCTILDIGNEIMKKAKNKHKGLIMTDKTDLINNETDIVIGMGVDLKIFFKGMLKNSVCINYDLHVNSFKECLKQIPEYYISQIEKIILFLAAYKDKSSNLTVLNKDLATNVVSMYSKVINHKSASSFFKPIPLANVIAKKAVESEKIEDSEMTENKGFISNYCKMQ